MPPEAKYFEAPLTVKVIFPFEYEIDIFSIEYSTDELEAEIMPQLFPEIDDPFVT